MHPPFLLQTKRMWRPTALTPRFVLRRDTPPLPAADEANVETHGFDPALCNNHLNPACSPLWLNAIVGACGRRGNRAFCVQMHMHMYMCYSFSTCAAATAGVQQLRQQGSKHASALCPLSSLLPLRTHLLRWFTAPVCFNHSIMQHSISCRPRRAHV